MEIGNKVLGFKPKDTPLQYVQEFIGRVGYIDAVQGVNVRVNYGSGDSWWYLGEEVAKHIVADDYEEGNQKVKFKKFHPDAKLPQKMTEGAACMDVFATEIEKVEDDYYICKLGFGITPPKGHKVVLVPRSSLTKTRWMIINTPCQGDEDFYHEYQLRFRAFPRGIMHGDVQHLYYDEFPFKVGERIGQIFIEKVLDFEWVEVDELKETSRLGGYGSTSK